MTDSVTSNFLPWAPPQGDDNSVNLLTVPLAELITRKPVWLPPDVSVRTAAKRMTEDRISSMLVVDDGRLCGIVTDRDLRGKVVAAGSSYERPLREIMTREPLTVDLHSYGFEALLTMAKHRIHHLPVTDGERLAGMITATDLLERRSTSAVYLVGDIFKRTSVDALTEVSAELPQVLLSLVDANASADSIGYVISSIGEAVNCRLLQLAEDRFGPAPVPFTWLTGGSLGRFEQTALSDQDNCLLLSDAFEPQRHGDYFQDLAHFVCDGLHACGYVYCPGEVMATTPQWRQPLATWKRYFDRWIDQPEPKALMLSCIFFDLRPLYGDQALFRDLSAHVLQKSRDNQIYLAYMTANALTHRPPLSWLGRFVYQRSAVPQHRRRLDLKHRGVIPIVDLARIYSLAGGIDAVNTQQRLDAAAVQGELSEEGAADLRDALEFISSIRLQHQARQIKRGDAPDNFLAPSELSRLDRRHLKDAFATTKTLQSALSLRYQAGRLG